MKLVQIRPGEYVRAATNPEWNPDYRPEEFLHKVRITQPFCIGVHEVTQDEYEAVLGINPSAFQARRAQAERVKNLDTHRFPVENVTWEEAVRFCERLSRLPAERAAQRRYRLPTEAEWEYACRAGTTTEFPWGDAISSLQANFNGTKTSQHTLPGPDLQRPAPVGSYQPNAWGLWDMNGNVWEWCSDHYALDFFKLGASSDPQGPAEPDAKGRRVLRGGSFRSQGGAWSCRSAHRYAYETRSQSDDVGFRVVMTLDTAPPSPAAPEIAFEGLWREHRSDGFTALRRVQGDQVVEERSGKAIYSWKRTNDQLRLTNLDSQDPDQVLFGDAAKPTVLRSADQTGMASRWTKVGVIDVPPPMDLALLAGETREVEITVQRRNHTGPIELRVEGLPPKVKILPVTLNGSAATGRLEFVAAPSAPACLRELRLVAKSADHEVEAAFHLTINRPRNSAPFQLTMNGLDGKEVLDATAPPSAWRKAGVFAELSGEGNVQFPLVNADSFAFETECIIRNKGQIKYVFQRPDGQIEIALEDNPPKKERMQCLLYRVIRGQYGWEGGRLHEVGERQYLTLLVAKDQQVLYRDGERVSWASAPAAPLQLRIFGKAGTDATIFRCSCRPLTVKEAAKLP
jgi:formylglycine-generating enzyme required for sulfatase activity